MEKVAAWEGVTFTAGDILLVRTGWLRWHDDADDETRIRLTKDKHENVGVAASEATAAWIWYAWKKSRLHPFVFPSQSFGVGRALKSNQTPGITALPAWQQITQRLSLGHLMEQVLLVSLHNDLILNHYSNTDHKDAVLHEYLLAMLGCPIGELWDLEALSELCASNNRWSFFLTSAPINIRGCIATPANALAVL